ncbi:hypothetical protein ACEV9E_23315 [Vibrio parahaemolyticus]|nr:hypothetical protein [Vibrio parahaemolyticus]ELS9504873.1 hypothetical protein [Vibrio parahaemolyticus]HCH1624405.1 hypothetical protein [Vibrio parahaemolyticus]HCM1609368.1 hypothetical protein [Vibrio parahaemolyticus]
MDSFLNNVTDVWWWLLHIPAALVALAIAAVFKKAPLALKRAAKWLALRELKRIKRVRFNYSAVTYEIMKSHALMLLFSMLCIAYFYVYVQTSQSSLNWLVLTIKTSPLYVVEILYLIQRDRTKSLVRSVGKIRITKRLRVIPNA